MNGHTFTYSGNDVYSLCGFVENSGTMTINGSGGTIVSDEVGLNSKEGVLNVNDVTIKANRIGIYNEATVLKLKNVKFDESCGTDVQLGSNGTIDLSEYNGNAITIDIDYNINDGKKHRYVKNKKDENEGFEDFDDEKIFQVNTGNDNDGNKKVTITFNRRKAKDVTDKAVDKVADVTDKVKDIVTEKVGEENIEKVMDKVDEAKDKAMDAKDVFVEKVGEENIQIAKDKVKNVVNQAKDIVSEFVGKDDYEEV